MPKKIEDEAVNPIDRLVEIKAKRKKADQEAKAQKKKIERKDRAVRDRMDRMVEKRCGPNAVVDYSAYNSDDDDVPINNLNEIAFLGAIKFRGERNEFYGGKGSHDWESPVLTNPTWLDLCEQANAMILTVNDHHHCFFEGFEIVARDGEVQIAEFIMGS